MILRRLADAITAQNWFTVVLEIFIVVVGIFIGLQVDDWNQSRKDRITERQYVERLLVDAGQSLELVDRTIDLQTRMIESAELVVRALQTGKLPEGGLPEFHNSVRELGAQPPLSRDITTLTELQNSGGLLQLRNMELRDRLGELAIQTDYMDKQIAFLRDRSIELDSVLSARYNIGYDLESLAADLSDRTIPLYEFDQIKDDLVFRSAAVSVLENRLRIRRWFNQYREVTLVARDALRAELGLPIEELIE